MKGSGGDLGTLKESGLAVLRLDRMRALVDVYPGVDREDEMVAAFDYCLHGKGGAAPSIDTAMHGLVDAAHVDHLHPDSGIAFATADDGEKLTAAAFGGKVVWVPWRRPGFQLGLDIAAIKAENPQAIGCILGGHGITAWGDTSDEAEANSLWIIETAQAYIDANGKAEPFGKARDGTPRSPTTSAARRPPLWPRRSAASRRTTSRWSATSPTTRGCSSSSPRRRRRSSPRSAPAAPTTSCAPRSSRCCSTCRPDAPVEEAIARLKELHEAYRADYTAYYEAHATPESPAIRGADPLIVLVPGVGMFSYGANKQTARVAGEFYLNAINVMRGAEALSTYSPISDAEKFRIEYWALEEAKLQRMPKPKTHQGRIAFVTGAASGIGKAIATRLAAEGACVVVADLDLEKAQAAAAELGGTDVAIGVAANVADAAGVQAAIDATLLAFGGIDLVVNNAGLSLSKPLLETTEKDWDLQHDVMAKGSFLVSKAAAKALIEQGLGGDIIYISSKNSVFAGPNNIAYSATKADQAHQVRLLAVELGEYGVRVNGINPDGVVRGSGHLRVGLGREPRRDLRRQGRGPRQVLRAAHDPQARGRARERRRRGVRADRTRAHAARRACTSRSTPASPPRSCDERSRIGVGALATRGLGTRESTCSRRAPMALGRTMRVLAQSMCSRRQGDARERRDDRRGGRRGRPRRDERSRHDRPGE